MPDLPTGTVTFLFSDIEGSTWLVQNLGARYDGLLEDHRRIVRRAAVEHCGHEIDTAGDSFLLAFATPADAVGTALAIQHALLAHPWPDEGKVRVRIGIDTGEARLAHGRYTGVVVHRAARVCSAAHGGQTLVSSDTQHRIDGRLPAGASLQDLGEHRLKDLARPERLFQVDDAGLPASFPPIRTLSVLPNNLPQQVTSLVGREREIAEVGRLLEAERLVTLTAPGGSGKTRLALHVAAEVASRFPDGVRFVELAPVSDSEAVRETVAKVLGVREEAGCSLGDALREFLSPRTILLLVDNCEHVVEGVAEVAAEILVRCPFVRILATSRERLATPGEALYAVDPLRVPDAAKPCPAEEAIRYEAVRLFVERARASDPGFSFSDRDAEAVASICRRLDGIPLAIELAAARISVLGCDQIAARLDDRFRLLTRGSRTAPPRHQTLRAVIDWSYDWLTDEERALFRRLSAFAGRFSLEAAEEVGAGEGLEREGILDLLTELVTKSVVLVDKRSGEARYGMLESIRDYARARLVDEREDDDTRTRHMDHFLGLAERAEQEFPNPNDTRRVILLEEQHDDVRAALGWEIGRGPEGDRPLRLAAAFAPVWRARGHIQEGRRWLDRVLDACPVPSAARAKALMAAGGLATSQNDAGKARALQEEAVATFRTIGDEHGAARALVELGMAAATAGDHRGSETAHGEARTVFLELNDVVGVADATFGLAWVALARFDFAAAGALFEEALPLYRDNDCIPCVGAVLTNLAFIALAQGDYPAARGHLSEGLSASEAPESEFLLFCVEETAEIDSGEGHFAEAAILFGGAAAIREATGYSRTADVEKVVYEAALDAVKDGLSPESFDAAWNQGYAMTMEEAVAYARVRLGDPSRPPGRALPRPAKLCLFQREGDYWTVGAVDAAFRLRDAKGLGFLAALLARPNTELHVMDLVLAGESRAADPASRSYSKMTAEQLEEAGLHAGGTEHAGEILDDRAKAAYKLRLVELRAELEEAQSFNDPGRAERAQAEIDALAEQLMAAAGLGGRDRKAGSAAERARLNVTRTIRAAVSRITQNDPELGRHLEVSVRTGTFCSYAPDPGVSIRWQL